jgi:nucleotide-binding universal stress UspA family protein
MLVGVDFSAGSLRALEAARSLAARRGLRLTVAHVRPASSVRAAIVEERGDLLRGEPRHLPAAIAKHYARRLASVANPRAGERTRLLRGVPARALCREARRGYDVLVLGSRGRGRVARFLLGSTVQEVLQRSPVPVLVAR